MLWTSRPQHENDEIEEKPEELAGRRLILKLCQASCLGYQWSDCTDDVHDVHYLGPTALQNYKIRDMYKEAGRVRAT